MKFQNHIKKINVILKMWLKAKSIIAVVGKQFVAAGYHEPLVAKIISATQ
jgi:hypothetical protein